MYWPNVLFLMLLIFPDSFDPMFLCIWTQCVLTHGVLTHCVRTQCGAQKCIQKEISQVYICNLQPLLESAATLWVSMQSMGREKFFALDSPLFRTLLICRLSFYMTRLNVLYASNVDV